MRTICRNCSRSTEQGAQNGGFESGVRLALQKILVSPDFLFRAEVDPPDAAPGSVHRISDIELASRLSFFLWSSIPDDELLAVAESGRLSDPSVLQAQVKRMLADPTLAGAGEELRRPMAVLAQYRADTAGSDGLPELRREPAPGAGEGNRAPDRKSVREDRSVADLLSTDYTFLNERLAEHYGIKGIYGNEFRRVKLDRPEPLRACSDRPAS